MREFSLIFSLILLVILSFYVEAEPMPKASLLNKDKGLVPPPKPNHCPKHDYKRSLQGSDAFNCLNGGWCVLGSEKCCSNSTNDFAGCCNNVGQTIGGVTYPPTPECCISSTTRFERQVSCCYENTTCCFEEDGFRVGRCCNALRPKCCSKKAGTACCEQSDICCNEGYCCPSDYPTCCGNNAVDGYPLCCMANRTCCMWPPDAPVRENSHCCLDDGSQECCAGQCCTTNNSTCCWNPTKTAGKCCATGTCCAGECCASGLTCVDSVCKAPESSVALAAGLGVAGGVVGIALISVAIWQLCCRAAAKEKREDTAKARNLEAEKADQDRQTKEYNY